MTPERWQQVKEVLHGALELAPEQRCAFLDNACSGDQSLRQDVESLLASSEEAPSSFLHSSAMRVTLTKGARLGDYEVQSLLGSGGMGEVYRAHDRRLDRDVAIKVLPSFLSSSADRLQRFEQEAQAAAALNHPNILAVFQMGTYEGAPYLVSELLEGMTLREYLQRGPLPIRKAIDYAIQMAHGLAAAHDKGIVHRDLKPENLFVTKDGRIKILDFGLAKLIQPKADSATARTLDHPTEPGVVMGTVGYMSPEQVKAKELDARTDLFSFGTVLCEMVTGRMPFEGESPGEICGAILHKEPTPPAELNPQVSAGLEAVILRALEKDRNLRYESAADMRAELQRLKRETESAGLVTVASGSSSDSRLSRSVDSLAVLPLVNATGDPETEYLSDGISESIINLLSQLPNLRVIARTSAFRYKGREADLKMIGRDLNVRTILTGKMIQRGGRLVVQAELVDVPNDAQIWGGHFNRKLEDIFDVQEELARQISENLQLRLTSEEEKRLARRPTQNREAYQFLLKAQYHLNRPTRESLQRALAYARQAIEADPGYAEAYGWMSATYSALGLWDFVPPAEAFPKAKAAAHKALEIDDSLGVVHAVLGIVRLFNEWDWSGAENSCKRAIELNPNYAGGHGIWSDWLTVMGRIEEAIAEQRLAVDLDPLSPVLNAALGAKIGYRGDYDHALEQLQKALELDPNLVFTNMQLALNYSCKGMYDEGLAICQKVVSLSGNSARSRAFSSLILAIARKTDEAQKILIELKGYRNLDSWTLFLLAETCSVMGEKTKAFEFLEVAYHQRGSLLTLLNVSPSFRNIRTDPRYADLLRRMRLPQAPLPHPEAC